MFSDCVDLTWNYPHDILLLHGKISEISWRTFEYELNLWNVTGTRYMYLMLRTKTISVMHRMSLRGGVQDDTRYLMNPRGKLHGLVYIINNKEFTPQSKQKARTGTDVDASNLKALFTQIGYKVTMKQNMTALEMLRLMEQGNLINF